jgi:nicotinate-nucleotide pyrophosphorylase (carboxylating)
MESGEVAKAVELNQGCTLLEVSGGITLANVKEYAAVGVNYISIGALSHSAPAVDISFLLK